MQWLKNLIDYQLAGKMLLGATLLLLGLHLLVFADVVPADILWGDQLTDENTLFVYEIMALVISLLFIIIVAAKMEYITTKTSQRAINLGLWAMAAYFVINMVGNLTSGLSATTLVFALITLVVALLSARVAIE